jgi:DNA-3-methyladenine glycosylase II
LATAHGPVDPYDWDAIGVEHDDYLAGLVLHMVAQRISVKAALAVFGRLQMALGGAIGAEALACQSEENLRAVGVSRAKARALIELGRTVAAGELDLHSLLGLADEEVVARLVTLPGVGRWSAQMFLLHERRRPDVFPSDDVGLRATLAALEGQRAVPDVAAAARRAEVWAPYRSYAAAHLWLWRSANRS